MVILTVDIILFRVSSDNDASNILLDYIMEQKGWRAIERSNQYNERVMHRRVKGTNSTKQVGALISQSTFLAVTNAIL